MKLLYVASHQLRESLQKLLLELVFTWIGTWDHLGGPQFHLQLIAPDRTIEVPDAIAIVTAKTLIARSGFFCQGGWLSTDWHSQVYQVLSMSEWNRLGDQITIGKPEFCEIAIGKPEIRDRDWMAIGHPKNSSFCRISYDRWCTKALYNSLIVGVRPQFYLHSSVCASKKTFASPATLTEIPAGKMTFFKILGIKVRFVWGSFWNHLYWLLGDIELQHATGVYYWEQLPPKDLFEMAPTGNRPNFHIPAPGFGKFCTGSVRTGSEWNSPFLQQIAVVCPLPLGE